MGGKRGVASFLLRGGCMSESDPFVVCKTYAYRRLQGANDGR